MTSAIIAADLGKCYKVNHLADGRGYRTLRESISRGIGSIRERLRGDKRAGTTEDFWALQDLDFAIEPGEVVGVIGRNGAGKSTLLKILSRITKPSTGQVELRGRVGSLLEVGTGFHPELTGRENIFLNGAILGMPRRQIAAKFDEIVDFAGVERFLDTPVKRYSSGMYVRLAFAVAAGLEADVLLVDEVLAVGDAAFQKKCIGRMHDLSTGGRTILFVSHSMPAVRSLTQRCLYLRDGRLVADGPTARIIDRYLADAWGGAGTQGPPPVQHYRQDRADSRSVCINKIWFSNSTGRIASQLEFSETFSIHCEIESRSYRGEVFVACWLTNQNGERVATFFSPDQVPRFEIAPGRFLVQLTVRGLPLSPGRYYVTIGVNHQIHTTAFDVLVDYPAFDVKKAQIGSGECEWPDRPWGCVHWEGVSWTMKTEGS
jgi:lipopolysaccharide transport system ATP-binding protein